MPQPACVAQRNLPGRVDPVHADPPVTSLSGCQRNRFDGGVVGLRGCFPIQCPVWALMVIDVAELLQLGVEVLQGVGPGLAGQPFFQGLMEALNFSLSLRVARGSVLLRDLQGVQQGLEAVAAAFASGEAGGIDQAVVSQGGGREPVLVGGFEEGFADGGTRDGPVSGAGEQVAGVVIKEVQAFGVRAVGQWPVGEVGLPGLVRLRGFEAVQRGFWSFSGAGVTSPAACRIRRIVEVEGAVMPSRVRCQAIVTGPASRPAVVRSRRRDRIRSAVGGGTRRALLCGRRERGVRATLPPSR